MAVVTEFNYLIIDWMVWTG